jgi:hypothetical protein
LISEQCWYDESGRECEECGDYWFSGCK